MLYVSRRIGARKLGIVDTDDNTESIVSSRQVAEALQAGLKIEGIEVLDEKHRKHGTVFSVNIRVYQSEDNVSRLQAKTSVIKGVSVITSGNLITGIRWKQDTIVKGTSIRLSDFGTECSDFLFYGSPISGEIVLTVVLDDTVKLSKKALERFVVCGVAIDITSVTKQSIVRQVYSEYISCASNIRASMIEYLIRDRRDRQSVWEIYRSVVSNNNPYPRSFTRSAIEEAGKMFVKEFTSLANSEFRFVSDDTSRRMIGSYIRGISRFDVRALIREGCSDYRRVRDVDNLRVLSILSVTTTCNATAIQRMLSFMTFFEPPDFIQDLYLLLWRRANNWYLDFGEEHFGISDYWEL